MIEKEHSCCRIICGTEEEKKKVLSLIGWIGKVAVERLMKEEVLKVFIHKSQVKNMDHCSVVKCSMGIYYSIPRIILEPVKEPAYNHYNMPIDRETVQLEERWVKIKADTAEARKVAFDSLSWIGDITADRLMNESRLEVRKKKSGINGMEHCCVVQCSRKLLFAVPVEILERVEHG